MQVRSDHSPTVGCCVSFPVVTVVSVRLVGNMSSSYEGIGLVVFCSLCHSSVWYLCCCYLFHGLFGFCLVQVFFPPWSTLAEGLSGNFRLIAYVVVDCAHVGLAFGGWSDCDNFSGHIQKMALLGICPCIWIYKYMCMYRYYVNMHL